MFQAIQLNNNEDIINENLSSNSLLEIKISIGAAKITNPVSETTFINSIFKDLMLYVYYQ